MRLSSCVGHHSSENCDSSETGNKSSCHRLLRKPFKYSSFRKVVAFRILVGTEWALLVGSILFPDFEMWSFISARVKKGICRMSADQPLMGNSKDAELRQFRSCRLCFYPSVPCALYIRSQDPDLLYFDHDLL